MRRRFDPEFRAGAVRIVKETGKPVAHVDRDLGINEYTLHNWVQMDRHANGQVGSARWSCGFERRWAGERGGLHPLPEACLCTAHDLANGSADTVPGRAWTSMEVDQV
ncbi:transposase [Streptosporangium roseum]|uniref:transposase n=1 Tax=Streptosporangium roseum TaxID=2001 RepID=UPI0009DCCB61